MSYMDHHQKIKMRNLMLKYLKKSAITLVFCAYLQEIHMLQAGMEILAQDLFI